MPFLKKEFNLANDLAVPKLIKVMVVMGVGRSIENKDELKKSAEDLSLITGQIAKVNKAKKAISAFKLKIGDEIGLTVTLREIRMWEFLDKVFNVVLPRTKDFKGLKLQGFDGRGNYSFGFTETTVFPEINPAKVDRLRGLQITIVTNAKDDQKAKALLKSLGCPFRSN